MDIEELEKLTNLLWKFKVKHGKELNKKELNSLIEILGTLIIKINK